MANYESNDAQDADMNEKDDDKKPTVTLFSRTYRKTRQQRRGGPPMGGGRWGPEAVPWAVCEAISQGF
jgi:hypothetical protein